ncbi:MAG: energy transducer TonB [Gammaproteobacteria bacterium]|nr:energy transducer TonB [Gammaproteobacteria bacterium]
MAQAYVTVDPLDELRLMPPVVPDRLPAMLFLAALVHGILIIGVTFNPQLANPFADAISLEVTIVADPDQQIDRPDEAQYLAQASQEGGGNITDQIRPSAPLQSAIPVDNQGSEDGTALNDARAHEQSADEVLASENSSDRQVTIDPRTAPQAQDSIAIAMEAGSEITLPLPQEDEASFLLTDDDPQQLVISADTRESVAAAYLDAWKRRVEAVGADYLPQLGDVDNLIGSPTLLVRISESGELLDAQVSRSSGSPVLDLASVDIIQRAAPFDEFPPPMADEYDTVAFEYKFLFTEQLVQRD